MMVGQHPALPTIQHQPFRMETAPLTPSQQALGTRRAAPSCCSQGGGSCSPSPGLGWPWLPLVFHVNHSCVREGKRSCPLDCCSLSSLHFIVLFKRLLLLFLQINAIFWGFHSLDLQWVPRNMLSRVPEMCPKKSCSRTDHSATPGNLL